MVELRRRRGAMLPLTLLVAGAFTLLCVPGLSAASGRWYQGPTAQPASLMQLAERADDSWLPDLGTAPACGDRVRTLHPVKTRTREAALASAHNPIAVRHLKISPSSDDLPPAASPRGVRSS